MNLLHGYAVEHILHQGPDVIVCRARRVSDGLAVVLKGLRPERASARAIARLRHEQAITEASAHPGVIRVLDVEESEGGPVLVLEDFGGTSLDTILGGKKLSLLTSLRIGIHVADALASLHHAGVIHKDVKPHNLLVRLDPLEVKLADFGIATRLSQEAPSAENPADAEGTLAYMSPEQTGWMNRSLDYRTDLYSLGVTLYEMVTGAPPFTASSTMELVHCQLARTPAPPHAASVNVPRVLSDIIMKLLSKAAEDRYQCAEGLRADLEECLRRYEADGRIDPFPLGRQDVGGRLWLPERLYGREAETQAIVDACERAAAGAAPLFAISGQAGIGKSALVHEVYKVLARRPGYFVSGKFGQLEQRTPYAAIAQAFGELCERLLSEREDALSRWKARLTAALGSIGQVVVDVIPELARLIGPQPPAQPLGPNESRNRFGLAFQNFVRALTEEHLLVLFIDDLQWADPASLKLIELLMTDPEGRRTLVIGAYRDDEVDGAHPVARLLADLRAANAARPSITEVWLGPLELADVRRLIADALRCRLEDTADLAALVLERTAGNPFFINQLLRALAEEGIVRFDPAAGAWSWDLERARGARGADGVVELVATKIGRLAPDAQRALQLAACVGHRFDLRTLAIVGERPPAEVAAALWEALREGLVVPLSPDYRLVHSGDAAVVGKLLEDPSFRASYRFLHDRVQQAAYARIDGPERERLHHRIGRLLLASAGRAPSDEELFVIVGHLNLGAALIEDRAERRAFLGLNVAAGRRALAATAYDAAFGYLSAAAAALGPELLADEPGLAFDIQAERAECAYLSGRYDDAEALFDALLDSAASDLARVRVHCMRMVLYNAQYRLTDTLAVARRGLGLFGVDVPSEGAALGAALGAELAEAQSSLAVRRIEDIGAGPELTDPRTLAVIELHAHLVPAAYFLDQSLAALVGFRLVNLSFRHGNSPLASLAYSNYGFFLAAVAGQTLEGYRLARMAVALNERYQVAWIRARLEFLLAIVMQFSRPQRETLDQFQRAMAAGMETGDFMFASAACVSLAQMKLCLADELRSVREDIGGYLRFTTRTKDAMSTATQTVARQVVLNLEGRTRSRGTLSDAGFDEEAFAPTLGGVGFASAACFYYTSKLALAFLYGDRQGALRMALRASELAPAAPGQFVTLVELPLYTCLTIVAVGPEAGGGEGGRLVELLASSHGRLAALGRDCPELRHLDLLVRAERARAAGEALEPVLALYQEAIEAAEQAGYVRFRALASELCGRFLASRRLQRLARSCLVEAHQAYARWGAAAKVQQMEETYAELLPRLGAWQPSSAGAGALSNLTSVASSTTEIVARRVALLDAAALIRAAQAVAREVDLGRVMTRLLRLTIESVGAQRGAIVLEHEGGPRVEAVAEDEGEVRVGPSVPVRESGAVAASVIEAVISTKGSVLVGDAARDPRFEGDPGVAARRVRSVLGLPMVSQGDLSGILYLENNAAPDIFSPSRLEVLELIASQAAVAVKNALLYARVQAASDALRRANDALEAAVSARTAELSAAKAQLEDELAERVRAEGERAALQGDLIRVQRERLAELSTPLIPITDRIMVMPLIGTVDAERADQALEAALRSVADTGAEVVILDITGVRGVDTGVAATLVRTATALRLLGAEAVITGIRSEVSQTLVGLEVDLSATVIRGTLQQGIVYATRRTAQAAQRTGPARGSRRSAAR